MVESIKFAFAAYGVAIIVSIFAAGIIELFYLFFNSKEGKKTRDGKVEKA